MSTESTVNRIMDNMVKPLSDDFHCCPVDLKRQILSIDFDIKQCEFNQDLGEEYEGLKAVLKALIHLLSSYPSKEA